MKDLQLINTLCESRIFRSKADLSKYSKRQLQDLYYSVLLSTIALALDTKTMAWARQYASAASAFANFDFFRVSANDLYVLTYLAQNELRGFDKREKMKILRLYKGLGRANVDRSFLQQTLLRLERSLFITDTRLRNARRTIINWGQATPVVRKQTITQLHRFIHVRAKLAEVLPYLKVLLKDKPGRFGKGSALKDIAAAAAGGLAGLAVGMRADTNRQWRLFNSAENEAPPLNEDRPTQLFQIVQDMKEHPDVEKVVGVTYLQDGISAFVRTTDGNAYEMQIRPAKYAQGHHKIRGLREGWDWCILGEEIELQCDDCGKAGDDVVETVCPYTADVMNMDVECVLCTDCAQERANDI